MYGTNSLNLGTASSLTGQLTFKNGTNANTFQIAPGVTGASISWTLPTAVPGGANYLLNVDADGTMGYTDPAGLGGDNLGSAAYTDVVALWTTCTGYLKSDGTCDVGTAEGGTTSLPWDNITSRPTINSVTVTGAVLDNVLNYPASLLRTNGSAASLTSFPTFNQNTTGTAAGLTAQYIDWNSGSGGASIANKPTIGTVAALTQGTMTNSKICTYTSAGTTINCNTDTSGTGDVVGPASATDNAIAVFDGTTGKLVKNSGFTIGSDNSFNVAQSATQAGFWRGYELSGNGTNYVAWQSPDALAGNVTWTLPNADSAGAFYSNGSGAVSLKALGTLGAMDNGTMTTTKYCIFTAGTGIVCNSTPAGGITDVVQDTTPQLGGNLDMNGQAIDNVSQAEMEYLNGVTSGIQGQLNAKAPSVSPSFTTPTLGVATATSINKMAITTPATSSTLAVADGKTFTASNTLTLTGTDGSSLAVGTGGTLGTGAYATIANYAPIASPAITGSATFAVAANPDASDGATLGTSALEWSDLYLTDGAVIYGQNDQSATLTSSASTWTANNFAATTSLALPNGANPTTDAAGEVAVDTSATTGAGLRVYAHATYGAATLPLAQTRCTTIDNAITTSDYPLEKFPYAVTIRSITVYQVGADNVIGGLDECTGTAGVCSAVTAVDADITGTNGAEVADDGSLTNGTIAAGNRIYWHTTSVGGTNTYTQVCFIYTVDAVN